MNSINEQWVKPEMEIIPFCSDDIIRTSGTIQKEESGFGDVVDVSDLFQ